MKLSIITINYNNCEGLRKTIYSVVSQTWQEFEWIIVDGGSTDGSRELIEETAAMLANEGTPVSPTPWRVEQFSLLGFTAEDWKNGKYQVPVSREASPRALLWTSEKDNGIYNAMNKGIVMARGEFLNFMNSGDSLYDDKVLRNVVDNLKGESLHIGDIVIDSNGSSKTIIFPRNLSPNEIINTFIMKGIPHQASFIPIHLFNKLGLYRENLRITSDWFFFYQACIIGNTTINTLNCKIALYDVNGISSTDKTMYKEREESLKELPCQQFFYQYYRNYSDLISAVMTNKLGRFIIRTYYFFYRHTIQ